MPLRPECEIDSKPMSRPMQPLRAQRSSKASNKRSLIAYFENICDDQVFFSGGYNAGSLMAHRVPEKALRYFMGVVLFAVGVKLLT